MATHYDIIVIGAGHNGLVTAAYLARAGWKVLVLERRSLVGGCCVTEELWPGFKVSTAAYVNSLFRPEIVRDLDLKRHGFAMIPRSPSSFTPFPDGRYLLMGPDPEMTFKEVSKFSTKDAYALQRYEKMLLRVADFIEPTLTMTPPNPWSLRPGNLMKLARLGWQFAKLGRDGARALEILTASARTILDRWFESEQLKVTLATDAIIGAAASPSMPGTAYVLFHHVMGECDGARGVWGYVRGGMGGLTGALASAARGFGAEIRTDTEVAQILVRSGKVGGVVLANGTQLLADHVASNADSNVTFNKLIEAKELPAEFLEDVRAIDYNSMSLKINVALSEPPSFTALPYQGIGPHHHGTMHIGPTLDYMEQAYDDAKYGVPSANPILECTLPSALDPTVVPAGKHLMGMFIQYAPTKLREGSWDTVKDAFAKRCFDVLNDYAPNFKNSILNYQVLSPLDLERTYGLTGGNIMQGAMHLHSLFFLRPLAGYADYRTPVKGLYLCGAAAHPGGGVMGAAGYNAAREILRDGKW